MVDLYNAPMSIFSPLSFAPLSPPALLALVVALVPALYGVGAVTVRARGVLLSARQVAGLAAALALGAGLAAAVGAALAIGPAAALAEAGLRLGLHLDAVTFVVLGLVASLGGLIASFSVRYLDGDRARVRYARALLATLGLVSLIVVAENLAVAGLAWFGTSVALHHLLTLYPERLPALLAAHKKFLLSRLADLALVVALALVGVGAGTLELSALEAIVERGEPLSWHLHLGAALFAVAVCLRSAQLPFHGWLVQVMEAPTPVSALLHAGVVNIGGFLLVRLSPLIDAAPLAQLVLLGFGLATALLASLVLLTRVSVKVALAWSTAAQMGFMLVECGLGFWRLALLHLVAHSFYKAHAFLTSGSVVEAWRRDALAPAREPGRARDLLLGLVLAGAAVGGAAWASSSGRAPGDVAASEAIFFAGLLVLALSSWAARAFVGGRPRGGAAHVVGGVVLTALVAFGLHAALAPFPLPSDGSLGSSPGTLSVRSVGLALVLLGFAGLWTVQQVLERSPHGAFARRWQPLWFAGLYLDEGFTRLTFLLWPPRFPDVTRRDAPLVQADTQEVGS